MIKVTERKFKKILKSKPYLLDAQFKRSRTEARQLALASSVTIEQAIQQIKQHSDIPAETWLHVDSALMLKHLHDKRRQRFAAFGRSIKSRIQAHRQLAVAALIIVLLLSFFTLVPTGRALAEEAFAYIMSVFENHIIIEPTDQSSIYPGYITNKDVDSGETVNEYGEAVAELTDFESFSAEYGLTPVRLVSDGFACTGITLTKYAATGMTLVSQYTSSAGDIVITQEWFIDGSMSFHSNEDFTESLSILDGIKLFYAIDNVDGVFDGIATLKDSVLWISAQGSVDILKELSNLGD